MTHKLVHSGIGCISMVDFDQITLLSLNCHVTVTLKDIVSPKATRLAMMFQIHKKKQRKDCSFLEVCLRLDIIQWMNVLEY